MAEPVYQDRPQPYRVERIASMVFEGYGDDARVDVLVRIDGKWSIIGHYLEGKYEGKRLLIAEFWHPRQAVKKWKARYGEDLTVVDLTLGKMISVPVW